ncbi:MAG: ABC transporter permease [Bacteroidales bacterium]|nr:ABC transporter permease [Bacteroidales bacterium]
MKNIINSFTDIFRKGNSGLIKIVLLGLGLAMGLTLIAKLYFENTYDSFIPENNRTYCVLPLYEINGKLIDWNQTPGGVSILIKRDIPSVEMATRYTWVFQNSIFKSVEKDYIGVDKEGIICRKAIIADTCFFKMFPRNVIAGNVDEAMIAPNNAVITKSFADRMLEGRNKSYSDLLGIVIASQENDTAILTISAIIDDFPENSSFDNIEMTIPMNSIKKFMWDGSINLMGNDRYTSYIRLYQDIESKDVKDQMDQLFAKYLDEQVQEGTKIRYNIISLDEYHSSSHNVKQTNNIMMILAIVVLVVSILNYILITLSALVRKAKTVAVRKCFGASNKNIYALVFSDTFVEMLVSLLFAILLLFAFEKQVEHVVGTSLSALISSQSIILLLGVLLVIFLICGIFPAVIYSKTPIATAFRNYKESNRRWKYVLLTFQFIASSFFIILLMVTLLQYNFVIHKETGYAYQNLAYVNIDGFSKEQREIIKNEVAKLPFVTAQTFSTGLPLHGGGGNNVYLPGSDNDLFNIADTYYVDDGFFDLLEVPIIEGRNFNEETPSSQNKEIMINRSCSERLKEVTGWDEVIGGQIRVTEHCGPDDFYTIVGVFENYLLGNVNDRDDRPAVQFYVKAEIPQWDFIISNHLVKMNKLTPENMAAIQNIYRELLPEKSVEVKSYPDAYKEEYRETRDVRDIVMIAGLVVLIITLIGLIGYCQDEMNRRRSELAIRKIHGATLGELLKLFLINVMKMAVMAVVVGCVLAYSVAVRLLELFSERIELSWWIFTIGALVTLVIVAAVVVITTYKGANANPVEVLKK